ncbi:hypothetical protein C8R44DRAFT_883670 [Mycena epipterygia]|nr:hypothetical protein C8R44DRAFT_883670 [Mycena epipterygia]
MSWLNFNLVPYLAKTSILPDTQVAMQQGVQTRDLMSYLSAIKLMKGFNYLAPQGMYDAVEAYGLPSTIVDLDKAAQTDTRCFIRTAHGTTEPIAITSVTKQGGSLSPLKLTLTTSLGHHYLNDIMSSDPDALIITSGSAQKADPHLPDDHFCTTIAMTEATDDSYIFSRMLPSLRRNVLAMERFQFAYGWLTQWTKSMAYVLEPSKETLRDIEDTAFVHKVKLTINELDFPRAKVDDPEPPNTLLRKIVVQNIVSKARALLSLQPIKRIDAEDLDTRIKTKMHMESGMLFTPSTDILTLPMASASPPSYRILARITLTDWTCGINKCTNPLDIDGLSSSFALHADRIPYGWIVAQEAISSMSPTLALKRTEIDGILSGDVSLSHILSTFHNHLPAVQCPNGNALYSLRTKVISDPEDAESLLYTDHMNAVRLIDDSKTAVDQQACLRGMTGRSYYRWILALVSKNPLKIVYTPGHLDERHLQDIFTAPIPTFFMDDFTFHTPEDGWIECNIRNFVNKVQIDASSKHIGAGHQQRMAITLYDPKSPPDYPYTRAYSAYSAIVQLYPRSGQLPTADILHSRNKLESPRCRYGCDAIEDQHHLFVHCERYAVWRTKATTDVYSRTNNKLAEKGIEEADRVGLLLTAKSLFIDNESIWPLHYSTYYLGHIPTFDHLMPRTPASDKLAQICLAHHLAADWHTAYIRLAGRIWGDFQREMAKNTNTRGRRK